MVANLRSDVSSFEALEGGFESEPVEEFEDDEDVSKFN